MRLVYRKAQYPTWIQCSFSNTQKKSRKKSKKSTSILCNFWWTVDLAGASHIWGQIFQGSRLQSELTRMDLLIATFATYSHYLLDVRHILWLPDLFWHTSLLHIRSQDNQFTTAGVCPWRPSASIHNRTQFATFCRDAVSPRIHDLITWILLYYGRQSFPFEGTLVLSHFRVQSTLVFLLIFSRFVSRYLFGPVWLEINLSDLNFIFRVLNMIFGP